MSVTTGVDHVLEHGAAPREPFPLAALARAYDLGAWRSVRWLTAGKNDHAHVITDRSTFFLRRSYRSKSLASLRWQVDLLRILSDRGLPVPVPLLSCDADEIVVLNGRLYLATAVVPGGPYDPDEPSHLRSAGRILATYHRIVAGVELPSPDAERQDVLDAIRQRLELVDPKAVPELHAFARQVGDRLAALWPRLPATLIHGGCRRGSLLFTGNTLTGVLDFDSARRDVRVLDLAITVHDIGKVYTALLRPDHKVALDLGRIARFLAAYAELGTASRAETEALPLLIAAKRAQRALGRAARLGSGEPISTNDVAKIRMETARLAWLQKHEEELRGICAQIAGR